MPSQSVRTNILVLVAVLMVVVMGLFFFNGPPNDEAPSPVVATQNAEGYSKPEFVGQFWESFLEMPADERVDLCRARWSTTEEGMVTDFEAIGMDTVSAEWTVELLTDACRG